MTRRWPVLAVALYVHLVPFVVYARDAWDIERVEPPRTSVIIDPPWPLPLSPPDPCGRHRHIPRDVVQPERDTCDPHPATAPEPVNTDPPMLPSPRLHRVSGLQDIQPPDSVRAAMIAEGKPTLAGTFKLCVDTLGRISGVRRLTSTGYDTYDQRLTAAIWNWRYQPFLVAGRPIEVCTAVTFRFTIR